MRPPSEGGGRRRGYPTFTFCPPPLLRFALPAPLLRSPPFPSVPVCEEAAFGAAARRSRDRPRSWRQQEERYGAVDERDATRFRYVLLTCAMSDREPATCMTERELRIVLAYELCLLKDISDLSAGLNSINSETTWRQCPMSVKNASRCQRGSEPKRAMGRRTEHLPL